jgi:malate/lactate dehydrogenase
LRDVALSMPTVVSTEGAVDILVPEMARDEQDRLEQSAVVLQKAYEQLGAR